MEPHRGPQPTPNSKDTHLSRDTVRHRELTVRSQANRVLTGSRRGRPTQPSRALPVSPALIRPQVASRTMVSSLPAALASSPAAALTALSRSRASRGNRDTRPSSRRTPRSLPHMAPLNSSSSKALTVLHWVQPGRLMARSRLTARNRCASAKLRRP